MEIYFLLVFGELGRHFIIKERRGGNLPSTERGKLSEREKFYERVEKTRKGNYLLQRGRKIPRLTE